MDLEGTTDAFCRGYFTQKDIQETETHYRCTNGCPDFEYRLIYKVEIPRKDYRYTLQIYDKDFFKSNDIIGEVQIDMKELLNDAAILKKPVTLDKTYYEQVGKKAGKK